MMGKGGKGLGNEEEIKLCCGQRSECGEQRSCRNHASAYMSLNGALSSSFKKQERGAPLKVSVHRHDPETTQMRKHKA